MFSLQIELLITDAMKHNFMESFKITLPISALKLLLYLYTSNNPFNHMFSFKAWSSFNITVHFFEYEAAIIVLLYNNYGKELSWFIGRHDEWYLGVIFINTHMLFNLFQVPFMFLIKIVK